MKAPKTLLSMVYNYMEGSRCCTFPTMVRDIASGQELVLWLPCVVAKTTLQHQSRERRSSSGTKDLMQYCSYAGIVLVPRHSRCS